MSKPYVIGFMGYAGVGKTTIARILREQAPNSIEIASFATPLKQAVQNLFLFSDEQVYGTKEQKEKIDPRWGISFRTAAQIIGTDCLRNMIDSQFHVKRMATFLESCNSKIVIIDDIRFSDEAELVNRYGGCYQIVRAGFPTEDIRHSSEYPPIHCSKGYFINNSFPDIASLQTFINSKLSFLKVLIEEILNETC